MVHRASRHIAPTKQQLSSNIKGEISIVIPAAGMGRRMKSYGPKALVPLPSGKTNPRTGEARGENVTLIERQLNILIDCYPNAEIFIVVGFQAEKIRHQLKDYPVRFIYNPLHESTNVLYSLGLAFIHPDTSQWFGYEALNHVIKHGGNFEVIRPRTMQLIEIDQAKDLEKIANLN